MGKYIYLVFSITPYKTSRFIRWATHSKYNHVSIAFDPNLYEMYSFARYYINTPFYAGFVRESSMRYNYAGKSATVKVCRLPVTDEQFDRARAIIQDVACDRESYCYNMLSALCYPFKKRVLIPKSYTCIEFTLDLMAEIKFEFGLKPKTFCSVNKFSQICEPYKIYYGGINELVGDKTYYDKEFERRIGFFKRIGCNFSANGKIIKRYFTRKKCKTKL